MGIGYTIDTPLKVAHYGIDSVISLVDDILLERMREFYCQKLEIPYQEITEQMKDFRAKRITSYLNLINQIAKKKFEELISNAHEKKADLKEFLALLPARSEIRKKLSSMLRGNFYPGTLGKWIRENIPMGSIDVNIMTKVDKENFHQGEKLPAEYNDAHSALRGFALSDLESTLILSAGMNPRLYSYLEQFEDFYPDSNGTIKKKIALKVSDYRSAFIQGKYLACKGLWVSEFRIESGLNCGGHAFATDGYLMGPILNEFKVKRKELTDSLYTLLKKALVAKNRPVPVQPLSLKVTAQGGVGTASEHQFLLDHYQLESVGWGTPFLLVPEVTAVDEQTLNKLLIAKEEDLYTSNISPLGVPFNSLRNNSKDLEKLERIEKGIPGSPCPKRYVALNMEFSEKGSCTASRHYQYRKIRELDLTGLPPENYREEYEKIVEKSCICVGLGTSALLVNSLDTRTEGPGVSVCPGPNLAYFSRKMSLKDITDHIYGKSNMITRTDRPHMFVKELDLYIDFLNGKITEAKKANSLRQEKYLDSFVQNINEGIQYYQNLFSGIRGWFDGVKSGILDELEAGRKKVHSLMLEIQNMKSAQVK